MPDNICFKKNEWFFETYFPGIRRCKTDGFKIRKRIMSAKTPFQSVQVFESPGFGKMLVLDGIIQLSESDEFIYHEMITHPAIITHPRPQKFLLIGGGDGGVLRESSKHPFKELWMVEIDKEIVELAKKHFSFISQGAFSDKRLNLVFQNGKTFIRGRKGYFDVIIVDSTDPVGPGKALFRADFYADVAKALGKDGVAVFQIGPFLDYDLIIKPTAQKLRKHFRYVRPIRLPMPSYSCGSEYCFLIASKTRDPRAVSLGEIKRRAAGLKKLRYYTPELHQASLVMPKLWQI